MCLIAYMYFYSTCGLVRAFVKNWFSRTIVPFSESCHVDCYTNYGQYDVW